MSINEVIAVNAICAAFTSKNSRKALRLADRPKPSVPRVLNGAEIYELICDGTDFT